MFRPCGELSEFRQAVEAVAEGIRYAVTQPEIRRLLVDSSGLVGFPLPTMLDRYDMGLAWVKAAGTSSIRMALVARPELIDPKKFGVLVAANRGVAGNVFDNEAAALAWLDLPPT
ncbi:hypothetical protein NA78x_004436 [Anatilimnocola sp. NA78]|uniref:hypothetical protein n=1 Tax=Anatilimnocola sp. NA78 TaxID=3415683 RepID=UPI003CE52D0A